MAELRDYDWTKEAATNVKLVFDGKADAHQQRRAVQHLVEILCGINQVGFDPENTHVTAFNAGRKWIGRQIQNALTIPLDKLVKEEPNEPSRNIGRPITATERSNKRSG